MEIGQRPSVETRRTLARTFSALRHRDFRLFWSGQLISLIGTWMQTVAIGWLVLELTNSAFLLGLVGAVGSLPFLFFSLFAGVVADRVDKRNLLVGTQAASMLLAFSLAVLTSTSWVRFWEVVVISGLLGVVNAFDAPTRQSFVVEMVGRDDLMNAIGLNSSIFNGARIVGPAIAGALLSIIGVAGCFYLNGVSFLAVIVALLVMKTSSPRSTIRIASVWSNLMEGLAYIRGNFIVFALIGMVAVPSVFGFQYVTLMPLFARDVLGVGSSGLGLLMAATGVGALAAALMLTLAGSFWRKGRIVAVAAFAFSLTLIGFAFSPWFPLSLLMLTGVGWATVSHLATTNTLLQTNVPDSLRGRVMSVYILVFFGLAPFGSFQLGALASAIGAPLAIASGSVICFVSALVIIWRLPQLRLLQ